MKTYFLDLKLQYDSIKNEISQIINNVIEDLAFVGGKYVEEFEEAFAKFCGVRQCIGVGNGTEALYVSLRALGIGAGDEVITVANSFIATAEAISMTGARVAFVDCHPNTYTIDVDQIPSVISSRTKAVIPVHLYGQPANMNSLTKLAKRYGIYVVEDAAQAHGAECGGRRVGSFGDLACFSFYPGKNLGAYGDAGAIVTNNEQLALKIRMLANHGRWDKYDHRFEGINSRLDGIQAGILSVKLKYLDDWNERRREVAAVYNELLHGNCIITPVEAPQTRHVYHLYVVRVPKRDQIRDKLKNKGIDTGIHYPVALPNLTAYKYLGHEPEDFPVASQYSKEVLSLPIYPELREEQVEYVCNELRSASGL